MHCKKRRALVFWAFFYLVNSVCMAENYADTLISYLRPKVAEFSDEGKTLLQIGMNANRKGEPQAAIEAFSSMLSDDSLGLSPDQRSLALAQLALSQEAANQHPDAMKTLQSLRDSRPEQEAQEIRFLADCEMARLMAQCGGHPNIPGFTPSIEEKEKQYNLLFSSYTPYRIEILAAHSDFAKEAYDEVMRGGPLYAAYKKVAVQQLKEVQAIAEALTANPALAADKRILSSLGFYKEWADRKIPRWERTFSTLAHELQVKEDIESMLSSSLEEESTNTPQTASSTGGDVRESVVSMGATGSDGTSVATPNSQPKPRGELLATLSAAGAVLILTATVWARKRRKVFAAGQKEK